MEEKLPEILKRLSECLHFIGQHGKANLFIELALVLQKHKIDNIKDLEQALEG